MIRVACVSDTHGRHSDLLIPEDVDLLLHAGDMTHFGKRRDLDSLNAWFGGLHLPAERILCVRGNHEPANDVGASIRGAQPLEPRAQLSNATLLEHESVVVLGGLRVHGCPYVDEHSAASALARMPRNADVLLTHAPPLGILDGGGTNGGSGGSGALAALIASSPALALVVCGHVHSASGVARTENTTVVNAAICGGPYGYAAVNPVRIVTMERVEGVYCVVDA